MDPCNLDWNLAGIWATACGTCGLAFVAWWQLRKFNDTERVKNAMLYLENYHVSVRLADGIELTPEQAMPHINAWLRNFTMPLPQNQYASFIIASNYFQLMSNYIERRIIDEQLCLDFYCAQIVSLADALTQLGANIGPNPRLTLSDKGFQTMVSRARTRAAEQAQRLAEFSARLEGS